MKKKNFYSISSDQLNSENCPLGGKHAVKIGDGVIQRHQWCSKCGAWSYEFAEKEKSE